MSRVYLECALYAALHVTVVRTDTSTFQFVTAVMSTLRSLCIAVTILGDCYRDALFLHLSIPCA